MSRLKKIKVIFFLFFFLFSFVFAELIKTNFSRELFDSLSYIRNAEFSNGVYHLKRAINNPVNQTNNSHMIVLYSYYNICLSLLIKNFYNFSYEKEYFENYKNLSKLLKNGLKKNNNPKEIGLYYFCIGSIEGYRGIYEKEFGNLILAFSYGLEGVFDLEKAHSYDSNNYDVYLGLGTFHYWKAVKAGWLPFNKNEKNLGLEQLKIALHKAQFGKAEALLTYVTVLIQEKDYAKARIYLNQFRQDYPENIHALFLALEIYGYYDNHEKLLVTFTQIERSYNKNKYYCTPIVWLKFNYYYAYYCMQVEYYDLAKQKISENLKMDKNIQIKGKKYYRYYYKESEKLDKKIDQLKSKKSKTLG